MFGQTLGIVIAITLPTTNGGLDLGSEEQVFMQ